MTGLKAVMLLWKFSLSLVAVVGFALDVHTHKRFLYMLLYQKAIAMRFPEGITPRLACSVLPHLGVDEMIGTNVPRFGKERDIRYHRCWSAAVCFSFGLEILLLGTTVGHL